MTGPVPRLVATDLDGTIVRSDGTVAPRTRDVIARVEQAGAVFVMVTGRPSRWMQQVSEEAGHRGLAVCANGAVLYDLHTETVVRRFLLEDHVARDVASRLREALPGIAFAVEHPESGFGHEPTYVPSWEPEHHTPTHVDELVEGGVVKILARHPELGSDALLAAAREAAGEHATFTHSSGDGLIEVAAVGISKASGLAVVCAERGVEARDVVAFGDMPNDLPMLAWAGRGVAVANAHPEVLEAADEVTSSNDEDGVAKVLERWF